MNREGLTSGRERSGTFREADCSRRWEAEEAHGFSPYETLYGRPPPNTKGMRGDLNEIDKLTPRAQMRALGSTLTTLHHGVRERFPASLTTDARPFNQETLCG